MSLPHLREPIYAHQVPWHPCTPCTLKLNISTTPELQPGPGRAPPRVTASGPSALSLRSRSFQMASSSAEGAVPIRPAAVSVGLG